MKQNLRLSLSTFVAGLLLSFNAFAFDVYVAGTDKVTVPDDFKTVLDLKHYLTQIGRADEIEHVNVVYDGDKLKDGKKISKLDLKDHKLKVFIIELNVY